MLVLLLSKQDYMFYNTLKVLLMWIFVIILCVNLVSFLWLWTPLEKTTDHTDAGLQPAATSRFRLRRTAAAAAWWSLIFRFGGELFGIQLSPAAPKRLRQQLASVSERERRAARPKGASVWSVVFLSKLKDQKILPGIYLAVQFYFYKTKITFHISENSPNFILKISAKSLFLQSNAFGQYNPTKIGLQSPICPQQISYDLPWILNCAIERC